MPLSPLSISSCRVLKGSALGSDQPVHQESEHERKGSISKSDVVVWQLAPQTAPERLQEPTMSSKNRNFRRKVELDQPADEPDGLGLPPASVLAARKAKEKEKKLGKKAPLLSFEEEEPETLVKAKPKIKDYGKAKAKAKPSLVGLSITEDHKPASTQRSEAGKACLSSIAKDFKRSRPQVPLPVLQTTLPLGGRASKLTVARSAGEYSAEKLKALKATAKSFTGPRAPMSSVHATTADDGDGGFKLSGSFKPAASKTDDRFEPAVSEAAPACHTEISSLFKWKDSRYARP